VHGGKPSGLTKKNVTAALQGRCPKAHYPAGLARIALSNSTGNFQLICWNRLEQNVAMVGTAPVVQPTTKFAADR
jgi:hypothetical protein